MKQQVQTILQRELNKIDLKSKDGELDLNDVRKLEVLLKAYHSCESPADSDKTESAPSRPTDEELIQDVLTEQIS